MTNFKMTDWINSESKLTFKQWLSDPAFSSIYRSFKETAERREDTLNALSELNLGITISPIETDWCHHRCYVLFYWTKATEVNQPIISHSVHYTADAAQLLLINTYESFGDKVDWIFYRLIEMDMLPEMALFISQLLFDLYYDARVVDIESSHVAGTIKILLTTPASYIEVNIDVTIINGILGQSDYFKLVNEETTMIYGRCQMQWPGKRFNPTYIIAE